MKSLMTVLTKTRFEKLGIIIIIIIKGLPRSLRQIEEEWASKTLHGRFAADLNSEEVDKKLSTKYLVDGKLQAETEGFIGAIQDQVVPTKNHRKYIHKENIPSDRCRLCSTTAESIQHLSAGCTYLAPKDYVDRHNKVAEIVHQAICKTNKLLQNITPYYKYSPCPVLESDEIKVYWDTPIITDREVRHNRPDILVIHKEGKWAQIIDITIPLDNNIKTARNGKLLKYQDLAHEIKDIYQLNRVTILPVIITSNGLVDKHMLSNLEKMGISDWETIIATAQKSVILSTCRTIRRVLATDGNVGL